MSARLRDRLAAGEVLFGCTATYPCAAVLEGLVPGWDWVWIDGQHGEHNAGSLAALARTAELCGVPAVVRAPGHGWGLLGPLADLGPAGVMIPMVDTGEQAQEVVSALRFPPRGNRSYGGVRMIARHGGHYPTGAGGDLLIWAQIETPTAVEHAEEIAAIPGVDLLFFGPDDMKLRLGLPLETPWTKSPELLALVERTAEAARGAGKWLGIPAGDPEAVRRAVELGYQALAGGADAVFLWETSAQRLAELRGAL